MTGLILGTAVRGSHEGTADRRRRTWTHRLNRGRLRVHMLLSFQRPSYLFWKVVPSQGYARDPVRSRSRPPSIALGARCDGHPARGRKAASSAGGQPPL